MIAFKQVNGDMAEAFELANFIQEENKTELLYFIDKNKMSEFEKAWIEMKRDLESKYLLK